MSTTENTEVTETVVAAEPKKAPAKKATAKKTAAKKAAAKPAAEPKVEKAEKFDVKAYFSKEKLKESGEKLKESAEKAQDLAKEVVAANLGVYGKIYDEVSARIESGREEAPKQWDELVKRGRQLQSDMEKSQEELKTKIKDSELAAKIKDIDLKGEIKGYADKVKEIDLKGELKTYADKVKEIDLKSELKGYSDKVKGSCEEAFDKIKGQFKKSA